MDIVAFCRDKGWSPDDAMLRLVVACAFSCIVSGASRPAKEMLTVAIDALDMYRRMLDNLRYARPVVPS